MARVTDAAIAVVLFAAISPAQTFEVASIKLSGPQTPRGGFGGPGSADPGRYYFHQATLLDLIGIAYHVDYFQISSKTPLDQQRFDLDAKMSPDMTREQFRLMMRHLLEERFHLKAHVEQKEFPGYELVVAKGGPKLAETGIASPQPASRSRSKEDDFPELPPDRPGMMSKHTSSGAYFIVRLRARAEPMSLFASWLHTPGDQPVVDKTGLTGKYDFTLEYAQTMQTAAAANADPPPLPDIFRALQDQLGLQLVGKKLPFDVVFVDSVDKVPTEN